MKEKLLPAALTGAVILGANSLNAEADNEYCVDDEARAMATVSYRQAVDADRTAVMIYLALTQQQGRPYSYDEYRELYELMVNDVLEGKDPMADGFRNDAGLEKTIFEEGGENEDGTNK